ncbi:WD40-repeat-containing domain protein [Radiomyces spectabilis]|uniref:WD40-repeat-containing domain protein n=1 Tax=Radiomyces spectabilis TaxID=64574 RepID=UPI00221FC60F|nr:WD40-repeat-containing domain protein [Radiomyces spectabilis]KAI8368283.1 WD40-repeat-containing domain protein [Radiomyces spectabilis]
MSGHVGSSAQLSTQLEHIREYFLQLDDHQRRLYLFELLSCCDRSLLQFVKLLCLPKCHVDFLEHLPIELALHVVSFLDNPRTLAEASHVSRCWHALLNDEAVWRQMYFRCFPHVPISVLQANSYHGRFIRTHHIESGWTKGGNLITYCDNAIGSDLTTCLQLDDRYFVVGSDNHCVEIYDSTTGHHVHTLRGHAGGVWCCHFITLKDTSLLLTGGCDREARLWDMHTGKTLRVFRGHTSTIRCLRLCNQRLAVTGSRDATIRVWDIERGCIRHVCRGHQASIRCLDVHHRRIVSGSYDATARLWDLETGECIHLLLGHYSQIYAIAFDGQRIATGSLDASVRIWCPDTGNCLATLQGHTSLVGHVRLQPLGQGETPLLVTAGSDGCVRIWNLDTFRCTHRIEAHDNSVTSLQCDDQRILSGGSDGRVKLWDIHTGNIIRSFTQGGRTVWKLDFIYSKAVVLLQRRLYSNCDDYLETVIELHDLENIK